MSSRWLTAPVPFHTRSTYDAFAQQYDLLQGRAARECWTGGILREIQLRGYSTGLVFDAGAGTGMGAKLLEEIGTFCVISCDASAQMLQHARLASMAVWQVDLAELPNVENRFRLVLSGFDALNYLNPTALKSFFGWVQRHLDGRDAALIFDYSTPHFLKDVWGNREYTEHEAGFELHFNNRYDAFTQATHIALTCSERGRLLWQEHHIQYSLDFRNMAALAQEAGLSIECHKELSRTERNGRSIKDVYVMKR